MNQCPKSTWILTKCLNGYLVDKIGSELVETLADKTEMYLQEYLDKYGFKMTNRYSPAIAGGMYLIQKKLFLCVMFH